MIPSHAFAFSSSAFHKYASAGSSSRSSSSTAARCSAVGTTSLLLWPMLTWSFGCTLSPEARDASRAITSFAFMFELVPLPVWNTSIGNSASHCPPATSIEAFSIAVASGLSIMRISRFTRAAAALMRPMACTNLRGIGSPEMGKFSTARWVCGP